MPLSPNSDNFIRLSSLSYTDSAGTLIYLNGATVTAQIFQLSSPLGVASSSGTTATLANGTFYSSMVNYYLWDGHTVYQINGYTSPNQVTLAIAPSWSNTQISLAIPSGSQSSLGYVSGSNGNLLFGNSNNVRRQFC